MIRDEAISSIVEALASVNPLVIYGFGSAFTGKSRPDSDVDVAYLSALPPEPLGHYAMTQELALRLGRDVDLVSLKTADAVLRVQVLENGVLIHCSDPKAKDEFEMYALSDYARLNEERKEILDRVRREGTVYG